MTELSIFVSSPGDVAAERALAARVIERLGQEFSERVRLKPIFWEHEPLLASASFQDQIVRPSETDIVVCVLWSRLGTRLPAQFTRADGSRYASGTEFEFEDAVEGHRKNGTPDLLVYRKTAEPLVSLRDSSALLEMLRQKEALDEFMDRWFHDEEDGTLRSAFHAFDASEIFEETLELHLRKLIERRVPSVANESPRPAQVARWTQGSPFRGLEVFDFEHSDVFFGRTRAVSEVLDRLREQDLDGHPFVLILGMSGGGKSSLARAGVVPMLTTPGVIEGVSGWRVAAAKPSDEGREPFLALATALVRAMPELTESVPDLAAQLLSSPTTVADAIQDRLDAATREAGAGADIRLLLLLDQLEELFTISTVSSAEREAFGVAISALVERGVWTVATMRSDLYPRLQEAPALLALKEGAGQYDLPPPTSSELLQMIRQPVLAAGLRLEVHPETGERLEDHLRDAAMGRPGSLPLLEFTLEELHRLRREDGTLTFAAFEELGGVEGSLARRAEGVWAALPADVRGSLPGVMRQLLTVTESPDGSATAARRAELSRLTIDEPSTALVEALVGARLLTTDLTEGGEAVVRIAHEALLRHWPRLKEWIEEDRETLKARGRLRGAAFRWAEENRTDDLLLAKGKPLVDATAVAESGVALSGLEREFLSASQNRAQRSIRLRRAAIVSMIALSIAAAGSAAVAWSQAGRAADETHAAIQIRDFMVGLFEVATPQMSQGRTVTVRELLGMGADRLLAGELEDTPVQRAAAARALASFQLDVGGIDSTRAGGMGHRNALELALLAADIEATQPDVPDSVRATTWMLLGEIQETLNQYDSAVANYERAAALVEGRFPGLEEEALARWGNARREQGDMEAYFELTDRATAIGLQRTDRSLRAQGITLTRQGQRLSRSGEPVEAELVLRQADSLFREANETETLDYTALLDQLAAVLQQQGRHSEAHAILERIVEIERAILPAGHEQIATSLNNLAYNADLMGNYGLAESAWRESRDILLAALGPGHQLTAQVNNNLAQVLFLREETRTEALNMLRQSTDSLRVLLPEGEDFSDVLVNFAEMLNESGNHREAEARIEEAYQVDMSAGRPGKAALHLTRRGLWAWDAGETARAEELFTNAIELLAEMSDRREAGRQLTYVQNVILQRTEPGRSAAAAAQAALDVRRAIGGPDPELAQSMADVSWWMALREQPDSADALMDDAADMLSRLPEVESRWLAAHKSLWFALRLRERNAEALEREQELLARLLENDAPPEWLVESRLRLGFTYGLLGSHRDALDAYEAGLELATAALNAEHPLVQELTQLREQAQADLSAGSSQRDL